MNAGQDSDRAFRQRTAGCLILVWMAFVLASAFCMCAAFVLAAW